MSLTELLSNADFLEWSQSPSESVVAESRFNRRLQRSVQTDKLDKCHLRRGGVMALDWKRQKFLKRLLLEFHE